MSTYETVLILKPVLSDQEVTDFVGKTKETITGEGGEIVSQEVWGRRKLAHPIGRTREGVYAYFKYRANPPLIKKLDHNFAITENILRSLTVIAQDRKLREKKKKKVKPVPAPAAAKT